MGFEPPSIRAALRKILPHLLQAKEQDLNEADTVQRIMLVLGDVLEYDPLSEISRETIIRGRYADIAIKVDGSVKFLVEAKSAGTVLRDRHIDQARLYAVDKNIPWVLLTNGVQWNLYHLTFDEAGVESDCVFAVDLSRDLLEDAADTLALLHRETIRKDGLEDFWRRKSALNPESLGKALFTESVLRVIRREIRRANRIAIDEERLVAGLKELFSMEAREAMGAIKVKRRRRKRKALQGTSEQPSSEKNASLDASATAGAKTETAPTGGSSDS